MASTDPTRLSSPQIFLWRMIVFLIIAIFVGAILFRQIATAFQSNPFLNGLIGATLFIGIAFAMLQVVRLFREVAWINGHRAQSLTVPRAPVLLAPMAALMGDRLGRISLGPAALRSILDSIGTRLDEDRDVSRYLTGLLVFLGLLGTFWGLTETVSSIGRTIQGLDVRSGELAGIFDDLKTGLAAPLSGMGTAFSSSLFGLAGSLVLGFLDLQAGQAQNRFYKELEDWLSTMTEVGGDTPAPATSSIASVQASIDRLTRALAESGGGARATTAMANLAEGIQALVTHMRQEQQQVRDWAEAQATQQRDMHAVLERLESRLPPAKE